MRSAIPILMAALVPLLVASVSPAGADTTDPNNPGTTQGTVTKADFTLVYYRLEGDKAIEINGTTLETFFNRTRCQCNEKMRIRVKLAASGRQKLANARNYPLKLLSGTSAACLCDSPSACASATCKQLGNPIDATNLLNSDADFDFSVRDIFEGSTPGDNACDRDESRSIFIWMDTDDGDDYTNVTDANFQVRIDGRGPPPPTGLTVTGGNEALEVKWDQIGQNNDLQGYQVLCSRGGDGAPFPKVFTPGYDVISCPGQTQTSGALSTPIAEAGEPLQAVAARPSMRGAPPAALASLNRDYLCSDILTSGTSTRIFRLQNDIPYVVGVISIDKTRNPSALTEVVLQYPTPTRDFYSGYRGDGGAAAGGFCNMSGSSAPGRAAWAALALAVLGMAARRRGARR